MVKVYVLESNGRITRYSTIVGTGIEVIQDNPVIDISKLAGYEVVIGEDGLKHLVFNEEKYNEHVAKEEEEKSIKIANEKLIQMALDNLVPKLEGDALKPFQVLLNRIKDKVEDAIEEKTEE